MPICFWIQQNNADPSESITLLLVLRNGIANRLPLGAWGGIFQFSKHIVPGKFNVDPDTCIYPVFYAVQETPYCQT
jgi:hypothetical protein